MVGALSLNEIGYWQPFYRNCWTICRSYRGEAPLYDRIEPAVRTPPRVSAAPLDGPETRGKRILAAHVLGS
jgi:hypothetical protein